jgi:hypothetical protein
VVAVAVPTKYDATPPLSTPVTLNAPSVVIEPWQANVTLTGGWGAADPLQLEKLPAAVVKTAVKVVSALAEVQV